MGNHDIPGKPPVSVLLRRSARARRMTLRVSSLDGRVTLTIPPGVTEREALAFARSREAWLRRHVAKVGSSVPVEPGIRLPVKGKLRTIETAAIRTPSLETERLLVPERTRAPGRDAEVFLKELARSALLESADHYSRRLGRGYNDFALRDTRSRWGSCSANGRLMFSWRLIMAPPEVLAYVAAHEVAHLVHLDHSPDFWARLEALYGPTDEPRRWLKEEGPGLHRWRFR